MQRGGGDRGGAVNARGAKRLMAFEVRGLRGRVGPVSSRAMKVMLVVRMDEAGMRCETSIKRSTCWL